MEIDMNGKVCIVTGANSGIGKVTARVLAEAGARLVMVCRNPEKGNAVLEEIKSQTGSKTVDLLLADLSRMQEVRNVVKEFKSKYDRLDVLINNAGIIVRKRTMTDEGFETTFAVNHLAPFLMTNLLLDILKKSAPSRIINVSSEGHKTSWINFNNLQGEKWYNFMLAYGAAKLANIMFTYELAKRLEGTNVTANCLHPGAVATNFGLADKSIISLGMLLAKPFLINSEKGATASIHLATSPDAQNVGGKYFKGRQAVRSSRASYNEEVAKKLWDVSAQLTGLEQVT